MITARSLLRFLSLAILLMPAPAGAQTIKLASLAPAGSSWDEGLKSIAAEWKTISNGTVNLKIYPGGIAGDESDVIRKVRIGQLQAAALTGVGLCRIDKGILAIQLPLTIKTNEELTYVLDKSLPIVDKALSEKGFKILFWMPVGWVHFFGKSPICSPDDLRKQKLFVWAGDPDAVQVWKEAGFNPVPLAMTDMMSSLQSGMVDAFGATPLSAASYQWFGLAKNMCSMNWAPLIGGIIVSNQTWQTIPPEMQAKLMASAQRIGKRLAADGLQADDKALTIMKQYGLTITPVGTSDLAGWQKIAQDGINKISGKSFDQASYERIVALLKEYRATKK